ncbi:MAG TPA: SnoaL-like domain-containing protein [Chitinophaga sp.]|uniref:SnoaL-like domain-containing protein n=1 Tax=Chitinophaga sp. TaxID=1869181 RepID=UPI002DBEFCAC|nr:SnoaL-like domain-containing protein [Chitinophaga sp.]HEU4554397.1 SnoaL-like domain-containing protein [Chitinophaga sp.]
MTTQEVANRYYELACQHKWTAIQDELYDDDIVSREPEHAASAGMQVISKGRAAITAKSIAHREKIATVHSHYCSEPIVAADFFSVALKKEVTFKNNSRAQLDEIGVFQVKDGKVILEQFFY